MYSHYILQLIFLALLFQGCKEKENWFPFNPIEREGISATDQGHWLDAPAGKTQAIYYLVEFK